MWKLPNISTSQILIYLRKSQSDDPSLSTEEILGRHEQMLDAWVARNFPGQNRISEESRIREVVSGETIDDRPGMLNLLHRIESPDIKAVLVVEPQRLSRGSLKDIGRLVELLRYSNTLVFTAQYNYDLRDPRDRESFERELMRGNDYLEYYKRIQQNGRLLSVQNGNYLGSKPPYGYRKIQVVDGKNTYHTLEPITEEARVVRMIFEMYRDGFSSHKIARTLNEMGIKTQSGCRWSPESLKTLRTNRHYIGQIVWNRRKIEKVVVDGSVIERRPIHKDCIIVPGKHPAIIDQELWDAVQEIRDKIPPVKSKTNCVNPFAGLVRCALCGRAITRQTYVNNPPRLLCHNQQYCGCSSCTEREMTEAVVKILQDAILDFELHIKKGPSNQFETHQKIIEQHQKRLEELNRIELSQWDKYTQEAMPKHVFDQLNAKVLSEKKEVQKALCTLRKSVPTPENYEQKKSMFSDAINALLDPNVPALEKNLLLKKCIERIDYSRKKKKGPSRRYGIPEPLELNVRLRV